MIDFADFGRANFGRANFDQQVRAYSIEKALNYLNNAFESGETLIIVAKLIEDYVVNGDLTSVVSSLVEEGLTEGRFEVKEAVEEWFSGVNLDDMFQVKGWSNPKQEGVVK